jgi:hypothetical protein
MHDVRDGFVFARCENIERYRRILRTHLTQTEREFVERRLGEEKQALLDGLGSQEQLRKSEQTRTWASPIMARHTTVDERPIHSSQSGDFINGSRRAGAAG